MRLVARFDLPTSNWHLTAYTPRRRDIIENRSISEKDSRAPCFGMRLRVPKRTACRMVRESPHEN
jgi:hypothetical protein